MWFIYLTDLAFCPIKLNIHYVSNMKKDLNKQLSYLKYIELYLLIVCGRFIYLVNSYTEQIFSSKIITRNGKLMIIIKLIQFIIVWYSCKNCSFNVKQQWLNQRKYILPFTIRYNDGNALSIGNTFLMYINTIIYFLPPFAWMEKSKLLHD